MANGQKPLHDGSGEIPPCLIGEFRDVNTIGAGEIKTEPLRFLGCSVGGGVTCSLDNVRLRMRFDEAEAIELNDKAETWQCDDYRLYEARGKVGGWRFLHRFGMGETSVVIGVGHISTKVNMTRGFVEFNPNKVARCPEFWRVWAKLMRYVRKASVARYDLAVDVPIDRDFVRLQKDRRMYQLNQSKSMTEYLGRRDASGFVKVYDKTAESGLDVPLTRVELTCDGDWSLVDVANYWPVVYRLGGSVESMRRESQVVALLLAEKVANGETVEDYMAMLNYRTRKKVRDAIGETCVIPFPDFGANEVKKQADDWGRALLGFGMFADLERWT